MPPTASLRPTQQGSSRRFKDDMKNPNNCNTCDHKRYAGNGHCYMFRDSPTDVCMQHTGRKRSFFSFLKASAGTDPDQSTNTNHPDAQDR